MDVGWRKAGRRKNSLRDLLSPKRAAPHDDFSNVHLSGKSSSVKGDMDIEPNTHGRSQRDHPRPTSTSRAQARANSTREAVSAQISRTRLVAEQSMHSDQSTNTTYGDTEQDT